MKPVYGYVRVSDKGQENSASPEAQKSAIQKYAHANDMEIIDWFEETKSAARRGRPLYTKMINRLRRGYAKGVIFHKIDRSARNGRDWSDLTDLLDIHDISIEIASTGIDLTTRGGRLQAEIEQVIAADFIRNLKEEVKKGLDGRLEDGIYPFAAPLGYLDTGKGNVKTIDPVKAPLVKKLFELYATGDHTLDTLLKYANKQGLTNTKNKPLCINSISLILHNPFYTGVIKIKKTGQTYAGNHKPLISIALYEQAQRRFQQHKQPQVIKHNPILKSLIRCKQCQYGMPAEKQKGNYYYRCQQKQCPTKSIREDVILNHLQKQINAFAINDVIKESINQRIGQLSKTNHKKIKARKQSSKLAIGKLTKELERLTDLLINGTLDEDTYLKRKEQLNLEIQKAHEQTQQNSQSTQELNQRVHKILELCFSANLRDFQQNKEESRKFVKLVTSNFFVDGKKPLIELKKPFCDIAKLKPILPCVHQRRSSRINPCDFEVTAKNKKPCKHCGNIEQVARVILENSQEPSTP